MDFGGRLIGTGGPGAVSDLCVGVEGVSEFERLSRSFKPLCFCSGLFIHDGQTIPRSYVSTGHRRNPVDNQDH